MKTFCFFLTLCYLIQAQDSPIVLPPVTLHTSLPKKMLVFIPGGSVPNAHYVETAAAIQQAARQTVELWVVIPAVSKRLCILSCPSSKLRLCSALHKDVKVALDQATEQGWIRTTSKSGVYLAGHSLGGTCANYLFQAYQEEFGVLMVMGSYVDKTNHFDLTSYPIPVLTLDAELDAGMARPGRVSIWWRQYQKMIAKRADTNLDKPVIILQHLNHSNFCPGFDVPGDLPAEVTQAEATETIGKVLAAFISIQSRRQSPRAEDVATINSKLSWTKELINPYITAEDMTYVRENHTFSKKKYYPVGQVGSYIPPDGTSRICEMMQHTVGNLNPDYDARLMVKNVWYESTANLEHCHTNFTVLSNGTVLINTCAHTDYYPDLDNTGSIEAASQLSCKFGSTEQIAVALKIESPEQPDCKQLNKQIVALAESLAYPTTLARFKEKGRGWCFKSDSQTPGNIGPLWLAASMELEENATCMQVTSPVLLTGINSTIYPGNFYCKILSPERVLDWMMSDSLKPFTP